MSAEGGQPGNFSEVYVVLMELHDFMAFASREISGVAVTAPLIHNSALNYAVNPTAGIHRVPSDDRPHYLEDFERVSVYATPAALLGAVAGSGLADAEPVRITYNAVNTVLQVTEEFRLVAGKVSKRKVVLPRMGAYVSYPPRTLYRFFALGGRPPSIVRVGKKGAQARLRAVRASEVRVVRGRHRPDHPVNPLDLPGETRILSGALEAIPPWPLLTNAELDGPHLEVRAADPLSGRPQRFTVAMPNPEVYRSVRLG
ncbi:MAG: type I-D CRISPR-associated protein Cas5/Csc1 [Candidatus Korarchaeota archaeon]|nr:type I-D CRISPR-associated protein Cas5/Csc1 [Candidatus Korarchaeota archaeon]